MNGESAKKRIHYLEEEVFSCSFEHTCGAEDQRDCVMMKHIIMAEIHKSNVPAWVIEELEKKFDCVGCWGDLGKRASIKSMHHSKSN